MWIDNYKSLILQLTLIRNPMLVLSPLTHGVGRFEAWMSHKLVFL